MLKELEETLENHNSRLNHLQKEVSTLKAQKGGADRLTYSAKEAAAALGVKATTIRKWIKEGKLTAANVNGTLLINVESVMKLINP